MPNNLLIREFSFLIAQTENEIKKEKNPIEKNKNMFRLKSFKNFLKFLKKYPYEITSEEQLEGITDIGAGTRRRVKEILSKGFLQEVKRTTDIKKQEQELESISSLMSIIGIGESKAKEFVEMGIKSASDLDNKVKKGKIEVNDKILLGLKYRKLLKTNIPREEMNEINKFLLRQLHKIDSKLIGQLCGSYRREKKTSNDIDLLISHPKATDDNSTYLRKFIKLLHEKDFLKDDLTGRNVTTKYMGFCKYKNNPIRRIDIRFVPYNSYPAALLYFTGSGVFNKKMRKKAISLGYLLNEYGLFKDRKQIKIKSEEDIFNKLKMKYVEPSDRN